MTRVALAPSWTRRPVRPHAQPRFVGAALADLADDVDELLFLTRSAQRSLAAAGDLHSRDQVQDAQSRLDRVEKQLRLLRVRARFAAPTAALVDELATTKVSLAEFVRTQYAVIAALATASDWQSPSFLHSVRPAAGRHTGLIRPYWNDYKRDRHLDAAAYEAAYVAALHGGRPHLGALLTSCGMAAFATVLNFLLLEGHLAGPVVIGRALYHETKELLVRALPRRLVEVDERDTAAVVRTLCTLGPSAVFFDSLCNTRHAPMADLAAVLDALRGRSDCYVVVDNTGLPTFEPFSLLPEDGPRLIVFESLLKYLQLGMDRANAGVIVARGDDVAVLDRYREHLGTNVSDFAVQALPELNRAVLERRLLRIERNATLLAGRLEPLARVAYPGLARHPSHGIARARPFRGGCISIGFGPGHDPVERGQRLVETAIADACAAGVPLHAGTSFGFDITRIYLTASRTDVAEPFVRISAGTEHVLQARALGNVLARSLARVAAP